MAHHHIRRRRDINGNFVQGVQGVVVDDQIGEDGGAGDSQTILNADELELNEVNLENEYLGLEADANANPRNETTLGIYKCVIAFGLFMFYEALVFFTLLAHGFATHHLFGLLSHSDIRFFQYLGSFGSYYNVIHICLLLKFVQDHAEQNYGVQMVADYLNGALLPSFDLIYTIVTTLFVGICYFLLYTMFYFRCKLLSRGLYLTSPLFPRKDPISSLFVIPLSYILYFNVARCIRGSQRTKVIYQMIQNALNISFGMVIVRFGGIWGNILFEEGSKISYMNLVLMMCYATIFLTTIYGSGTKWAEILWACLTTDFLLRCFFGMSKAEDIEPHGIQFLIGTSYFLFLTTKNVLTDIIQFESEVV